jgi:hypothetical protein
VQIKVLQLQLHRARFDARQVKQVIDQRQQVATGLADVL